MATTQKTTKVKGKVDGRDATTIVVNHHRYSMSENVQRWRGDVAVGDTVEFSAKGDTITFLEILERAAKPPAEKPAGTPAGGFQKASEVPKTPPPVAPAAPKETPPGPATTPPGPRNQSEYWQMRYQLEVERDARISRQAATNSAIEIVKATMSNKTNTIDMTGQVLEVAKALNEYAVNGSLPEVKQ